MKTSTITIDLDQKCKRCGKPGAMKNGICMDCLNNDIKAGKLNHIIHPETATPKTGNEMKITVSRNELMAALLFASGDDSRPILNSVCIETRANDKPTMVATDGRRLVVIETKSDQPEDGGQEAGRFVLRADFLKPVCALNRALQSKLFPLVTFTVTPGSERVVVEFMGGDFFMEAHKNALAEGEFPNWRQVLPPRDKGKRIPITDMAVNAELVGDFAKAAKLLDAAAPVVQMNLVGKEQQIEVKLSGVDNFYGLLMQCKLDEAVNYQPEFLAIVKDIPTADSGEPEDAK